MHRQHHIRMYLFVLLLASVLWSSSSIAEFDGEFFIFPQFEAFYIDGLDQPVTSHEGHHGLENGDHYEAAVDLFLTFDVGNFRFLGEFLASTEEAHMERFQLGWNANGRLYWLGRFHNPIGYWNTVYHHGAYTQTSISRPAIIAFEEHSGILPMHQAGLLAEGMFRSSKKGLGYSFAFATGPQYDGELHTWDPLDPSAGDHDISLTANIFQEIISGRTGLFANYNKIPTSEFELEEIEQLTLGGYLDHEFEPWQLHAAAYYVNNQLIGTTSKTRDEFFNAYLQAEYLINDHLRFFGRGEYTLGDDDDDYLGLFPDFVKARLAVGMRYDFAGRQALKLELQANQSRDNSYGQVMLQWSAQF